MQTGINPNLAYFALARVGFMPLLCPVLAVIACLVLIEEGEGENIMKEYLS